MRERRYAPPGARTISPRTMKLRRQLLVPGRRIEQVGRLSAHPFFTRERDADDDDVAPPRPPRARPRLARIAENAGALFSILVSAVLIVMVAALLVAFVQGLRRDSVVVAPVSVPQDIAARGYDAVAASQLVVNEIRAVQALAQTTHVRRALVSGSDIPDVHIIGAGMSMQSIVRFARSAFGDREPTIGGVVLRDARGLRMVIDLQDRGGVRTVEVARGDDDIAALLKDGAQAIVQLADPYVLASYLFQVEKTDSGYPKALVAIDYVLNNPPADDDGWALNLRGLIEQNGGKLDAAEATFRRARGMPGAPLSIVDSNLQVVLALLGRRADAHALVIEDTIAADAPFNALIGACRTFYWLGFADEGRRLCDRAQASDPHSPDPFSWRALYDYDAGHYAAALRQSRRAAELSPRGVFDYAPTLVFIEAANGDAAGALAHAAQFESEMPANDENRPWMHLSRSIVLANLARYAEAETEVDLYEAGLRHAPFAYYGNAVRGVIRLAQQRPREALAAFAKVLAINPAYPLAVAGKARALAALGQSADADRAFAEATRIAPDRSEFWTAWADFLAAQGNGDAASARRLEATRATQRAAKA